MARDCPSGSEIVSQASKSQSESPGLVAPPHRSCASHRAPTNPSRQTQAPSTQQPAWHVRAVPESSSNSPPLQVPLPPVSGGSKTTTVTLLEVLTRTMSEMTLHVAPVRQELAS
tara:strand:- start:30 stop:371 length:342 start_codon:yes stop_codon:yes gene_type:complete